MELVGLPRRLLYVYPSQLSGGQRQRVAIARALAMRPRDRDLRRADLGARRLGPGADPQSAAGSPARARADLVLVSHNLAVVEHMADRVAVMYLGRVIEEAARAIFAAPRHPYTQTLLASVLTPDTGAACRTGAGRRLSQSARTAARLHLPPALPQGHGPLPQHPPAPIGDEKGGWSATCMYDLGSRSPKGVCVTWEMPYSGRCAALRHFASRHRSPRRQARQHAAHRRQPGARKVSTRTSTTSASA